QRIAGRAAELLAGARRRLVGGIREALAARDAAAEREILALVIRQRLPGPIAERKGEPQRQPCEHAGGDPPLHGRPSKRSAEICSETSPTRKTTTANRMSSTDELVT